MDVGRRAGVLIGNQGVIMSQIRYELPKKARMHVNKMNMLEIGADQPQFIDVAIRLVRERLRETHIEVPGIPNHYWNFMEKFEKMDFPSTIAYHDRAMTVLFTGDGKANSASAHQLANILASIQGGRYPRFLPLVWDKIEELLKAN